MSKVDFMKLATYKTKFLQDYGMAFSDYDGNVYLVCPNGNYGYNVKDLETKEVIANPTQKQILYGLLNFMELDNKNNPRKQGHYHLNVEKLYYGFMDDMSYIDSGRYDVERLILDWAITGENKEMAVRGAVKDFLTKQADNSQDLNY